MLPPNPQLSAIRSCFGNWSASKPVCVGDAQNKSCAFDVSCRAQVNHLVLAGQLNRANRPVPAGAMTHWQATPPPQTFTPPPPAQAQPQAQPQPQPMHLQQPHQPYPYAPHYPPQHYPTPPHAAPPAMHGVNGVPPMPIQVSGVSMIPHATTTPATLSRPESRVAGKKVGSFVAELIRAAAKGALGQGANFFDEVPFGDERDR